MTAAQRVALDDLAHLLASHGLAAVDSELPGFLAYARRRGATPLLLSILAEHSNGSPPNSNSLGVQPAAAANPTQAPRHRTTTMLTTPTPGRRRPSPRGAPHPR